MSSTAAQAHPTPSPSNNGSNSNTPDSGSSTLNQYLQKLKEFGVNLTPTDVDKAKMLAALVFAVWIGVKVLEHFMHFNRHRHARTDSERSKRSFFAIDDLQTNIELLLHYSAFLVGVIFPLFRSCVAIETRQNADDESWLTFWVVGSLLELGYIWLNVFIYWLPFWSESELALAIWLQLPSISGAQYVYDRFLAPFYAKHNNLINSTFMVLVDGAKDKLYQLNGSALQIAGDIVTGNQEEAKADILALVTSTLKKMGIFALVPVLFFIFPGVFAYIGCVLVGVVYPAYLCLRALATNGVQDDTSWLVYWVVLTLFSLVHQILTMFLWWVPFWYAFELGVILYLVLPVTNGSEKIYYHVLQPYVRYIIKLTHGTSEALNAPAQPSQAIGADGKSE